MFHKFQNTNFKELNLKKNSFFLVDGITGSGKTTFSKILRSKFSTKYKFEIVSKDLFLKSREIRILITKKNKNRKNKNQNALQYDLKKYSKIINLIKKKKFGTVEINELYNRKTGRNDLNLKFKYKKNTIYIIEGIYVAKDFNFLLKKKTKKIFIEANIYESLAEKLRRIRDKKVSIPLVVNEYIKIHLFSYLNYIKKINFDFVINEKGQISKFNKRKILNFKKKLIEFLEKHQ